MYRVIKTINDHRYYYDQRTWREGGKVRCESIYVGPADSTPGHGSTRPPQQTAPAINTTTSTSIADQTVIKTLFEPTKADTDWKRPWSRRYSPTRDDIVIDRRLFDLTTAMRVTGKSRAWVMGPEPDGAWYSPSKGMVQIPDASRFTSAERFARTLLHELAHATRHPDRCNRPRHSYAEEEVTVELASSLIVQRLGLGDAHVGQSARYIQQWLTRCPDEVASRAFAEHEAKRVANYICALWDQLNTTN